MRYSSFLNEIKSVVDVSSLDDIGNKAIAKANLYAALMLFTVFATMNGLFLYYDAVYYLAPILFSVLFIPFVVFSLRCNLEHRHFLSSLSLFICYTVYWGGMSLFFLGKDPGFHAYNLILALLPFIVFKGERWLTTFLLMVVNLSIFIYVELFTQAATSTVAFPSELLDYKVFNTFVIFIYCAVILLFYRKVMDNKTKRLTYLANELEDKNRELEHSIVTKDKFFSIIAHDLKGPIGNLSSFLDLLSDSNASFTDEELRESLKSLKDSSSNTYSLLENLLNWSRIHTGDIVFDPRSSDLCSLINSAIDLYKPNAIDKGITINFEDHEPVNVSFDFNMINTVIRNLLNNSIKFSHPQGVITVNCNKSDNEVTVSFKDSGVGMSQQTVNELFQLDVKHYPTKGTSGESGSGLGLIMCKEFINRHGGEIRVESEEGQGSTISFTLPF